MDSRIALLAGGNFAVGSGALLVTGLLAPVAQDLSVSVAAAGQLTTAFAITVAIAGPLLATATGGWDRRRVLLLALLLFSAGQLLGAMAPDFTTLLATRVLAGLGACLYTPHAAAASALLAGPQARSRAIATVFGGFVVATVMGVPIGAAIAQAFGWRAAFAAVGVLPLVAAALIAARLRQPLRAPPVDGAAWLQIVRSPGLLMLVGVTAVQLAGQLMLFAYLSPLLALTIGLSVQGMGAVFMVYGIANLIANVVMVRTIERIGGRRLSEAALLGTVVAMFLMPLAQTSLPATVALLFFWGLTSFAINAAVQTRLVAAAPWLATASLPLNSSAIYVGQAAGAALGGWLVAAGHIASLGWWGGAVVVVALGLSRLAARQPAPRPPGPPPAAA